MAIEIIWFAKPLFFLLLLDVVYRNKYFFREKLSSIMKINLFIYVMPIIFSFITGVGLSNYDEFYVSTKSFFYGNNVTSITGFTLCIYFAYQLKSSKVNYIYFILAFISLFISGGKIILLVPFLTLLIYVYNKKRNNIRSILIGSVFLLLTSLFMIGFLDSSIFINNVFTQKYYSRTFKEGLSVINARQNINIIPLNWYSYASYSRATRANTGLNAIIDNPINLFFGYGTSMTSKIVGGRYDKVGNSEMDFIDIFLTYGILGSLLIYIPIIKIIFPLLFKREFGVIAMIIYLLFIYSSLAGHVITAPMAGSLFALFLGLGGNLKNNKLNNIRLQRKIQLVKAI